MPLVLRMEYVNDEGEAEEVAYCTIIKDGGKSADKTADYDVTLFNGKRRWKSCKVYKFNRSKLIGWDILCQALYKMLKTRNFSSENPVSGDKTSYTK